MAGNSRHSRTPRAVFCSSRQPNSWPAGPNRPPRSRGQACGTGTFNPLVSSDAKIDGMPHARYTAQSAAWNQRKLAPLGLAFRDQAMSKNDELRYGAPGEATIHLCVDMQRMFAEGTDWNMPWLERVLPNIISITSTHPERTIFTRFIPARKPGQGIGMWRHYYERWGSMTIDQLGPEMIDLVPDLAISFPRPAFSINMSIPHGPGPICTSSCGAPGSTPSSSPAAKPTSACWRPCWAPSTGASASSSSPMLCAVQLMKPTTR